MAHKCFISFKNEDKIYKKEIQRRCSIDMIDKSLNVPIDSNDENYIMQKIREDYLSDSTVTIHLIGTHSAENNPQYEKNYIKRELQASLYNGKDNTRNGILGIVLPEMYDKIYLGRYQCNICENSHNGIAINNNTVVKEFEYNYYIPKDYGCCWYEEDRYCILVKWDDFMNNPSVSIEKAFDKRSHSIARETRWKNLK